MSTDLKANPTALDGWKSVPTEPTAEAIAAGVIAAWPAASSADLDIARKAAQIVLLSLGMDMALSATVDGVASILKIMVPAYRAMVAAASKPPVGAQADDPMDLRLPCDVTIGNVLFLEGCRLKGLVDRARVLHDMAYSPEACRAVTQYVQDAARYRWLRDTGDATWAPMSKRIHAGATGIDAAIDAAIAKQAAEVKP